MIYLLITGVEGGFDLTGKKYEYEDNNSIVVLPDWTSYAYPSQDLPDVVRVSPDFTFNWC